MFRYDIFSVRFYKNVEFICAFIFVGVLSILFQWGRPEAVSNITYETCFRYTLIARISPLWNQVDGYLIQGRDFLLSASPLNAIKFEVIARGKIVKTVLKLLFNML
jgi:hypothetical protein